MCHKPIVSQAPLSCAFLELGFLCLHFKEKFLSAKYELNWALPLHQHTEALNYIGMNLTRCPQPLTFWESFPKRAEGHLLYLCDRDLIAHWFEAEWIFLSSCLYNFLKLLFALCYSTVVPKERSQKLIFLHFNI